MRVLWSNVVNFEVLGQFQIHGTLWLSVADPEKINDIEDQYIAHTLGWKDKS